MAGTSIRRTQLMWTLAALLILAGGALGYRLWRSSSIGGQASHQSTIKQRRTVALLGFQNVSERPDLAWHSTEISTYLKTELDAGDKLLTAPEKTSPE